MGSPRSPNMSKFRTNNKSHHYQNMAGMAATPAGGRASSASHYYGYGYGRGTSMMEDWDFEDWEPIAAGGDRGLTQGYARSTVPTSRALIVGCSYPEETEYRLKGACCD